MLKLKNREMYYKHTVSEDGDESKELQSASYSVMDSGKQVGDCHLSMNSVSINLFESKFDPEETIERIGYLLNGETV